MVKGYIKTRGNLFIVGLLIISAIVKAAPANLDKIVAIVNQSVITQSELEKRINLIQHQLAGEKEDALVDSAKLRQKVLDSLIDVTLQLQLAKRNGIHISDKELDAVILNIAKAHKLTLAELKEELPKREGVSFREFRQQLREQGLISKLHQLFLGRDISVSNQEIDQLLHSAPQAPRSSTQYHVFDILLPLADGASQEQIDGVTKVANQLAGKLQRGAEIDKAIKDAQPELKTQGIQGTDLGWRKINELPELFAQKVVALQKNQVTGPIQAPNGIHLLKLLAINAPAPMQLTRDQAAEIVFRRKLAEKIKPWLKELRQNAYIKIMQ